MAQTMLARTSSHLFRKPWHFISAIGAARIAKAIEVVAGQRPLLESRRKPFVTEQDSGILPPSLAPS